MLAQLEGLISPSLSAAQKERLHELERVVEGTLNSFLECGRALLQIRDEKLYAEHYRSFEDYCIRRWGITGHRGRELIRSTLVAETLLRDANDAPLPPDITESTLHPLSRFENPELQRHTWQLINSLGTKATPTTVAKVVRGIREAIEVAYNDCNGRKPRPTPPASELIFLRSVVKLAGNEFNSQIVCLSISHEQAGKFALACREISRRCETVARELFRRFPELLECEDSNKRAEKEAVTETTG